jgi:hypothetical protein
MKVVIGAEVGVEQIREWLGGRAHTEPVKAVLALLDSRMMEGAVDALDEGLGEFARGKRLGRMEALMLLKQEIVELAKEKQDEAD